MVNVYSIPPFGGERFSENQRKLKGNEQPCAICGRKVNKPFAHSAVVVGGGDWAISEAEENNVSDPDYMGAWGIGPNCHRKYLIK